MLMLRHSSEFNNILQAAALTKSHNKRTEVKVFIRCTTDMKSKLCVVLQLTLVTFR